MVRALSARVTRGVLFVCGLTLLGASSLSAADPQLPAVRGIGYPLVGTNGGLNQPGYKTVETIIAETKALGANTVRVTVTSGLYDSPNANASNKTLTAQNSPTEADLVAYLTALRAAGLKVVLVPFANTVAGDNVLDGTVRTPTDMAAFMADHTANHVRLARIAQQTGVESFVAFLDDTEALLRNRDNLQYWLTHFAQIRAVYSGQLVGSPGTSGQIFGAAATHFELLPTEIFDALDVIGCTCYFKEPLLPTSQTTQLTVQAGFRGAYNNVDVTAMYEYLHRLYMKPLLLSDTSFHSYDGSSQSIAKIYDANIPLTADQQEQADMFDGHLAALKDFKDKDWFQGITYSGQNALPPNAMVARFLKSAFGEDIGGKLAEGVVRGWFTGTSPGTALNITNTSGNATGGTGDDTFTVTGGGARTIEGGAGYNTVILSGNVAAYTVNGSFQSAQVSGNGLQLTLGNIHRIQFANGAITIPTAGATLSAAGGMQTITGTANNDIIQTSTSDQTIDTGLGNDIVVANAWYSNTLRVPAVRNAAAFGRVGNRLLVTITGTTPRWISSVGIAKLQFNDQTVTLDGVTVTGTALQTHLYGSPSNDTITTARTTDVTIAGSAGNDSLDGGASSLTVTYPEPSAAFRVSTTAGVTTVVKPNGTDTLRNVKFIKFTDQTLSFVPNTTGTVSWLGPVFSSASAEAQSFLRVENTGATAGTVTATIRNAETGQDLGQWISPVVQPNSSQQFLINTIEAALPAGVKPTLYSISLNSGVTGYLQHVLYRPADGTLTNLSTCDAGVTANPAELINVHSTILDYGFPSTVAVNNAGATAAAATLGVYDSRNGTKFGTYTTEVITAGGQARVALAAVEAALGINPGSTIYHYNIKLEGAFNGFLQHLVNNKQRGVITDMTTVCRLGAPVTSTVTTPRVPSVFSSSPGTSQSFLRFYNTGAAAGTVKVSLVNDTNGTTLGEWTSAAIPAGASQQVQINDIEKAITPAFIKPAMYSLVAQPQIQGFIQHVLFRPADGTLTNLSTCNAGVTANATQLINVHSTLLDYGFASSVIVANTSAAANAVTLGVYNSTTGAKLGTYTTPAIPGRGQLSLAMPTIEAGANIDPGPATSPTAMYHYNIKVESAFTGFLQHLVNNKTVGVITDMTTVCRLN
jgi:hypothetical protein